LIATALVLALIAQGDPTVPVPEMPPAAELPEGEPEPEGELAPSPSPSSEPVSKDGLPVMNTTCPGVSEFEGTDEERAGFCQLMTCGVAQTCYVAVRTWADKALRANERSFRAHFLMGAAQHLGEGNLPKALFHLERADQLLTDAHGKFPAPASSQGAVLRRILLELVYVHGEMDHHEQKIRHVDLLKDRLGINFPALKAWPLLKLKRWDEAREVAKQAIESDDVGGWWRATGLTALCAVESERRDRQAAYEACLAAAQPVMRDPVDGGVALSNAASASIEMFKFDEAERLWLESTRRQTEGTINPWGRLTHLYLRQGRFAEALSALREMKSYRMARPSYFDQQDQSDANLTVASLLIVAGRVEDALRITTRVAQNPDRQGTSSAAFEQNQGGNFIVDRMARLDVARRFEERAVSAPFKEAMKLRAKAAKLRVEAWILSHRAGKILADTERLSTTLRPECPGSIELPAWLDGEVVSIVGPGVALATIAAARKEESLPEHLAEPIFAALEAEAYLIQGDDEKALAKADVAVKGMVPSEALIRARAAAIGAEAARRMGRHTDVVRLLGHVLTIDPGVIRRLGHVIPVELIMKEETPAVHAAFEALQSSPRFDVGTSGYRLELSEDAVVLTLPDGSEITRAMVPAGPRDNEALARRIAKTAHEDLFEPPVDVTQSDIRSLDGGLGGGGRASERAKSVLDEVLEKAAPMGP